MFDFKKLKDKATQLSEDIGKKVSDGIGPDLAKKIGEVTQSMMTEGMQAQMDGTMENWYGVATDEELDKMEAQGCDMKEIREKVAAARAEKARIAEAKKLADASRFGEPADRAALANPIYLENLEAFKAMPRDAESDFVKSFSLPLMGKDKFKQKLLEAPLVYTSVVQSYWTAWEPYESGEADPLCVVVFAKDEAHRNDVAWLKKTVKALCDMKAGTLATPEDCNKLIGALKKEEGYFCWKVGASIADGADAWCGTYTLDQEELPKTYIPSEGIIPCLLMDEPEENQFLSLELVDKKFYTK
ncbi:hypothetical protein Dip510_000694 [Elusimicrobium posterum]|uniref:hypothetical protein n=1 Tax=Elusimicrobium posterum TaxID=3116653 RepID=UPI003C71FE95